MGNQYLYVFYANLLYDTHYGKLGVASIIRDLPDGVYLYLPSNPHWKWYLKDLTPVLIEEVPKPIRALGLLMGI